MSDDARHTASLRGLIGSWRSQAERAERSGPDRAYRGQADAWTSSANELEAVLDRRSPCGCPANAAGDVRCHVCDEWVKARCWYCGTQRGEGACPRAGASRPQSHGLQRVAEAIASGGYSEITRYSADDMAAGGAGVAHQPTTDEALNILRAAWLTPGVGIGFVDLFFGDSDAMNAWRTEWNKPRAALREIAAGGSVGTPGDTEAER